MDVADDERIYSRIDAAWTEWKDLDQDKHLLCPKVNDEDEEDYTSPGPTVTNVTAEEKAEKIQDAQHRRDLTIQLLLMLGLGHDMTRNWLEPWTEGIALG